MKRYYAQYHAARAVILHVHHQDCDSHDQLPIEIEKMLGTGPTDVLKRLRDKRNQVCRQPEDLVSGFLHLGCEKRLYKKCR